MQKGLWYWLLCLIDPSTRLDNHEVMPSAKASGLAQGEQTMFILSK
jgi:hypothetical protein